MAGKDHVVAGSVKNKAQAVADRNMPETAKAAVQARETEPRPELPGFQLGRRSQRNP